MWHERAGTRLVEPGDRAFWHGLWSTDAFRALFDDPGTGYAHVLDMAAQRPWWFVDSTQPYERRHFSVWFGQAFVRRRYDNPLITDLFFWHDLLHAVTFRDGHGLTEAQWRLAMRANEIAVSMETEILVYWRRPELRAQSFAQPIWHDALGSPLAPDLRQRLLAYRTLLARDHDGAMPAYERALRAAVLSPWPLPDVPRGAEDRLDREGVWALRRAVTLTPDPASPVEMELARYEALADPFFNAWMHDWREVEAERHAFEALCADGRWREAVQRRHVQWARTADENGVPYGEIARRLLPVGF